MDVIGGEKQLRLPASKAVQKRIEAHIRWGETELDRANEAFDHSIRRSPIWCEYKGLPPKA